MPATRAQRRGRVAVEHGGRTHAAPRRWTLYRRGEFGTSVLDPLGNARAAISISDGGHNWGAWTTYTSGAYSGRC